MDITKAILSLRPGAVWSLSGEKYEGLQWLEPPIWEGGQKKPTKEEVETEVIRLQKEWEDTEYQRLRAKEYPDFKDYLDAVVKGDSEKIQEYIDACLAVKAKYPKPEVSE
jgi:hypothetical protein